MKQEVITNLLIIFFICIFPGLVSFLHDLKTGRYDPSSAGIYIIPAINWLIFIMCITNIYEDKITLMKIDEFSKVIKYKKVFLIQLYYENDLNVNHITQHFNDNINFDTLIKISNLQLIPIKGVTTIAFKNGMDAAKFVIFLEQNEVWDKIRRENIGF